MTINRVKTKITLNWAINAVSSQGRSFLFYNFSYHSVVRSVAISFIQIEVLWSI